MHIHKTSKVPKPIFVLLVHVSTTRKVAFSLPIQWRFFVHFCITIVTYTSFTFAFKPLSFEPMPSDTPSEQESHESYPTEHTERHCFSFWLNVDREREEAPS